MHHLPRRIFAAIIAATLAVGAGGIAAADQVVNDVPLVASAKTATIQAGGTGVAVSYRIVDTGANDCDVSGAMTMTVVAPAQVASSASSISFSQADCRDGVSKRLTFTSSTPGTYNVTHTLNYTLKGGGERSMTNLANFTLVVSGNTGPAVAIGNPPPSSVEGNTLGGANVDWNVVVSDAQESGLTATCSSGTTPVVSGSFFALGVHTVACEATDSGGLQGAASFSFEVVDSTAPIVSPPADATAEATSSAGARVSFGAASASDAVDGSPTATCSPASGSEFAIGTTTVTCAATDKAGNTGTADFTVTVRDSTAPVLTGPSDISAEATGPTGAIVTYAATASDTVDGSVAPSCLPASGSVFTLGTTTISCTMADSRGNVGNGSFTVTISDTQGPVLGLPGGISDVEATGPSGAIVHFFVSATDLVEGPRPVTCAPASGSMFALGSTAVNCASSDARGNTASGRFSVSVVDRTAPLLTVPPNITAEATGPAGAAVSYEVSATDVVDGNVTPVCSMVSHASFALGKTEITCSATDAAGNSAHASFTVTVVDTTPPDVAVPDGMTEEATGPSGASAMYTASARDIVDGDVPVQCSPASASNFPLGDTPVVCTALDTAGNAGTASFTVKVVDTTRPALSVPDDMTAGATGPNGAQVGYAASASDLVDEDVTVKCTPASGSTFALGPTTVICRATDDAGNSAERSFTVTVVDRTAPVISVPADETVEATGPNGAEVTYAASASDAVDGSLPTWCTPASGSTFPLGSTTVTCTATDQAGNTGGRSFTVQVRDTTVPTLSLPGTITEFAGSASSAVVTYSASATDLVDGNIPVTCSRSSGTTFEIGVTPVTCSVTDAAGNTAQGSFEVWVKYTWTGFFAPVDNPPTVNSVRAGSAVPIKFRIGGYQGMNIFKTGNPSSRSATFSSSAAVDSLESTVTASTSSLSFDAGSGSYIYIWKTDKSWAGSNRELRIEFADGSIYTANFKLTR